MVNTFLVDYKRGLISKRPIAVEAEDRSFHRSWFFLSFAAHLRDSRSEIQL